MKIHIDLQPIGRRIEIEEGVSLLEAAQRGGVDIVAVCGGIGICATCKLRVVSGQVSTLTAGEMETLSRAELDAGTRLACQCSPLSDVVVEIPPESLPAAQKMQIEGREPALDLQPSVRGVEIKLSPPSLHDLRSDFTRLQDALAEPVSADLQTLGKSLNALRDQNWQGRVVLHDDSSLQRLTAVLPSASPLLGLAVDIGSTKLALYLIDLENGATLASAGAMNPQIAYGEDVVSRIAFANKSENNRFLLQSRLVETLNQKVEELCSRAGVDAGQVVDGVMVGNTVMHHLLTGLPVRQLGAAPYTPAVSEPLDFQAAETGLRLAAGARVYMPANIAGYVGSDHTAALLASGIMTAGGRRVLIDIGTNTEISLAVEGKIFSCSTASGPAFEGAHIRDGMRAAPGAIDRVAFVDGEIRLSTVGGEKPVGICGTGILNTLSEMLVHQILDERGVFRADVNAYSRYVLRSGGKGEFQLAPAARTGHDRDILVTRRDVHEIQLAKGAIRTGMDILLAEAGLSADEIDEWVIAGAFGTFLDLPSAIRIGMFPSVPLERFNQVGNAAGMGAKQMLLSKERRAEAEKAARQVNYVELTVYRNFSDMFVDRMYFQPPDFS